MPFDSLNLRPPALGADAAGAADHPEAVAENQRRFAAALGAVPVWLNQVHGARVVHLDPEHLGPEQLGPVHLGNLHLDRLQLGSQRPRPASFESGLRLHPLALALPMADASICTQPGIACAVLVADCLPVLLCSADGKAVGAAHAGWRGLAAGVIDNTVAALCAAARCAPDQLLAWLGPCIGPAAFEVGADVLRAFGASPDRPDPAVFVPASRTDGSLCWQGNLAELARRRLAALGVVQVSGGGECTVANASRFFSYRRDRRTGRMAAAIAIQS